jgi:MoxR-like ATPase
VLEERAVQLARAGISCRLPADFMLVAAANPCPCGWYRSAQRDCRCELPQIERYRQRISGPLLDRIDLHVWVPGQAWRKLEGARDGETSASLRVRVAAARARQRERSGVSNARLPDPVLDQVLAASDKARSLLGRAVDRLGLSARAARLAGGADHRRSGGARRGRSDGRRRGPQLSRRARDDRIGLTPNLAVPSEFGHWASQNCHPASDPGFTSHPRDHTNH